jgi:hypothetical protein
MTTGPSKIKHYVTMFLQNIRNIPSRDTLSHPRRHVSSERMLWEVISHMSRYFYIFFWYSTQETLLVHCTRFKNKNTMFSIRLASVIMQCAYIPLYEDCCLMWWHNIMSHRTVLMFWRNLLPPSSVCDPVYGVASFSEMLVPLGTETCRCYWENLILHTKCWWCLKSSPTYSAGVVTGWLSVF